MTDYILDIVGSILAGGIVLALLLAVLARYGWFEGRG